MDWATIFTAIGVPMTGGDNTTGCTLLVAQCAYYGSGTPPITDSYGNTWTAMTAQGLGGTALKTCCYYVINPAVGAGHTFTCGATGATSARSIMVRGYSGIEAQGFIAQAGANGTSTTRATGAVLPLEDDCLVVSFCSVNATPTAASGLSNLTTLTFSSGTNYGMGVADTSTGSSTNSTWEWGGASQPNAVTIMAFFPVTAVNLLDDNKGYWELDEGATGNRSDSSPGGHTAVEIDGVVGFATAGGPGGLDCADIESADAGENYLAVADHADLSGGDIPFAVQVFVNMETVTSSGFVTKGTTWNADSVEYGLHYRGTGTRFEFVVGNNSARGTATSSTVSSATWYHLIGWHDPVRNLLCLWRDGVVTTASYSGGSYDSGADLEIGSGGFQYDGKMAYAGFWRRIPTHSERLALYNAGAGLPYSSFTGSGGGSVTVEPSAVSATFTAVAPATRLAHSPASLGTTFAAIAPSTRLGVTPAALSAAFTEVAPSTLLIQTPSPMAATWAIAAPDTAIITSLSPVTMTWSAPAPVLGSVALVTPDPVALAWSAIAPDTLLIHKPAPLDAAWAIAAPGTAIITSPAPIELEWSAPAVVAGVLTGGGYNIYTRDTIDGEDTFVAFVPSPTVEYVISGFDPDSEQWVHVRAVTSCDVEDIEPRRIKRLAFDGDGNLILPVPNAPIGLRLTLGANGRVIAAWSYLANNQGALPGVFNVYVAEDADPFDFDTPSHEVAYSSARTFTADLGEFADETLVRVIVRAESADEAEELNENEIEIEADAAAPEAPGAIEVEVTAS